MKNSNPHIEQRLQERIKRVKESHSAFWMGQDVDSFLSHTSADSVEYVERLRKVQRATGNFVKIVTGKEIPVIYSSGNQSYTDGKSVVLSADLDPTKMDALVGTALHEGAHCLLSTKSLAFLPEMDARFDMMVVGHPIVQHAARLGIPLKRPPASASRTYLPPTDTDAKMVRDVGTVYEHVQMVMNVLEDRRIDFWMYKNAPGYRPYYEEMYNQYWHSPKIDQALSDVRCRESVVENYILHVINLTNSHFDPSAMPGLAEIRKIANLTEAGLLARGDEDTGWDTWRHALNNNNIETRFSLFPKLFADAVRIVELVYQNSTKVERSEQPEPDEDEGEGEGDGGDLPNLDGGLPRPLTAKELKELRDALGKQIKFLKGDTDKKELSIDAQQLFDALNASNASVVEVEGDFLPRDVKARVIIYRNVNKKTLQMPAFPFRYTGGYYGNRPNAALVSNPLMVGALTEGIRMGAVLAQRIRVVQDERPLTFNHQEHGRLDKRRVSALGHNARDVFSFTITEKRKPANVWLDIDFSGSMQGEACARAMSVAVSIAYAASKTRTLNVTIAIRDGGGHHARVAILYDSRRHDFRQLRDIVPHLEACGGTPESLAFESIKDEMLKMWPGERKFFINLSDGEPAHGFHHKGHYYNYGGQAAYKHCRQLMNEFRQSGINVMSYYVSNGGTDVHSGFKSMYGRDAQFIDVKNMSQIVTTLNKLLMQEAVS